MTNLRIVYDNAADRATITANYLGNLVPSNLKSNKKSKVWRGGLNDFINLSWTTDQLINCIVLPFTNTTDLATLNISLYNGSGTLVYDGGLIHAIKGKPLGSLDWGSDILGVNSYSYVGQPYIVLWLPNLYSVSNMFIRIDDQTNPSGYLEVSRLIVGKYWSPKFNTGFGMAMTPVDSSTQEVSDSGDLVVTRGTKRRKLTFDLTWMDAGDRDKFNDIAIGNSLTTPIFVSLFPEDADPLKEQIYQIFGYLNQESPLTHSMHTMYSGKLDITEI